MEDRPQTLMDYLVSQRVADETLKAYTPSQEEPVRAIETRSISPNPPEPGRNLLNPYLPGTREWTANLDKQINDMPYPSTTMSSEHLMGAAGLAPMAFTAYHGSARPDLSKFDRKFIGTGQGAQTYGHGHYVAENPSVAKSYQEMLQDVTISYKGKRVPITINNIDDKGQQINSTGGVYKIIKDSFPELSDSEINALYRIHTSGSIDAAKDSLKMWADSYKEGATRPGPFAQENMATYKRAIGDLDGLKRIEKDIKIEEKGKLYEVDIKPPKEQFLDWDKPLSEQVVFNSKISKMNENLKNEIEELFERKGWNSPFEDPKSFTGKHLYRALSSIDNPEEASNILSEMGIPGIRYLDQGSRGKGKGTYNYVVFSDKDVEILK